MLNYVLNHFDKFKPLFSVKSFKKEQEMLYKSGRL